MNNIEYIELHDRVEESYMSYAMATIVDRALPDVRDGNLPIHRRILYAMFNKGLTYNKPYAKSSEPVSETMKIHNHGDSSIYGSLALLTDRNESLLYPLIDGDGSFGKVYSTDSPAHMRYTFCRLNKFSEEMFQNINKNIVKMIDDGEHIQPTILPVSYPAILVKPSTAIAVGEACNFGSFNLTDVCKFTSDYIKDKNINPIDYLIPDFSTGAYLIYDKQKIQSVLETGRGKVVLRAKYTYDDKNNKIIINEIPYSTNIQTIIKEISSKMNKTLKEVTDVKDSSGFNKKKNVEEMGIVINLKRNINKDLIIKKLFKETSLECNFSFNMNCLVNNKPVVLGVKDIINEWLKFRRECIVKSLQYDLNKKNKELYLLLGLEKILLDIDKAVEIIRFNDSPKEDLMKHFSIDDIQADYILNIKLQDINKNHVISQVSNIQKLKDEVAELQTHINDKDYIDSSIVNDLNRISSKYGKPRQTEIIYEDTLQEISSDELIEDFLVTMIYTKENYTKKTRKYSEQQTVKDGDEVLTITQCSNKDKAMYITDKGNLYFLNIWEMNDKLPSKLGDYLPSILPLDNDETAIGMITTNDYKGFVLIAYNDGHVVKIPMESYRTKTNRTKLSNCLSDCGKPILITQIDEDCDLGLTNSFGKTVKINTKDINEKKSRNSNGITVMSSKRKGFEVIKAIKL
ncbi:DNA topoisomerase (ATP-hydrolyzing) subunit A [uncultured Clostridium sp.]|uniref:DNA topoisomerase (ATP-hydrolyzing) subunit A n=1 Tax=uncultured Clostridium sp. TaxID=59620 RepID=UPI0032173A68